MTETILGIVKARLNRLASDTSIDEYLTHRIEAAKKELERTGIKLVEDDIDDQVFLVDFVVWKYQNRDMPGAMPDWLRRARRERFLSRKGRDENDT